MNDLIAFLNARLDEKEVESNEVHRPRDCGSVDRDGGFDPDSAWCGCGYPAHVLREAAADRMLIATWEAQAGYDLPEGVHEGRDPDERAADELVKDALYDVLKVRAAVYSDHPDYRTEWTP